MSYAADVAFGLQNQQSVQQLLHERYDMQFVEQSRYATFDFISADGTVYVEVKSGRVPLSCCPSALMGANKVDAAQRLHAQGKHVLFVWAYADDIYCLPYDSATWATFRRGAFQRGGRDGIRDYAADTVFVPPNLLQPLRTLEVHIESNAAPSPSAAPQLIHA
jgi:hypothetical protein